ncbi:PucR family transcriptional regulator [Subtercola sp. Z020]|uniref:helix-turn-helix domain-containing protein n=1 Tax=Subtercola sp. Z020 TaxID=2080582 RepID=UPI000CE7FA64|nr:helix-turn-helix domain-containing protein [Subtercola sp. Z020]PPF77634.1 PucR family transcriptional regulator [Subtercola sp. Z020]
MTLQDLVAHDLLSTDAAGEPSSGRELTLARLLHRDRAVRRAAYSEALARRWIDTTGRTVVRALLVAPQVGAERRLVAGRRLAAAAPSHTTFIGDLDGAIYLATRDSFDEKVLDEWMRAESLRLGVPLRALGSAEHRGASGDLLESAEQARVAADLTAALPELQPAQNIDALGGWVLLHAVAADAPRLADISPAAEALARSGDAVQRETIETYLDAGGRTSVACARLHIHRTTLYYRLDNMPALVREALADGLKRSTLHLSLKLMRLREATGAV